MKFTFITYDEEYDYASRIASEIEKKLNGLELDTVNKEFVVTVEVSEAE